MDSEVIVVGGGPAGSSAAWQLVRQGKECLVLDREAFPREKLCAGWITPEVVTDLDFEPADYPHRFLTFEKLNVALWGCKFALHSPQHSIRRCEFDDWLLARTGARVGVHTVRHIERVGNAFVIDDTYRCRFLIGAAGTRCPVYRELFRDHAPRHKALQAVALELEYACDWHDPDCHLWFLDHGLPGYSWYVPKARGYLNIGVGGIAHKLKRSGDDIRRHWEVLIKRLFDKGLIDAHPGEPRGYSYFLRGADTVPQEGDAFIVGDAAGLATRDLCEGIGPAVKSGLLAAQKIAGQSAWDLSSIQPFTSEYTLVRRGLERRFLSGSGVPPATVC